MHFLLPKSEAINAQSACQITQCNQLIIYYQVREENRRKQRVNFNGVSGGTQWQEVQRLGEEVRSSESRTSSQLTAFFSCVFCMIEASQNWSSNKILLCLRGWWLLSSKSAEQCVKDSQKCILQDFSSSLLLMHYTNNISGTWPLVDASCVVTISVTIQEHTTRSSKFKRRHILRILDFTRVDKRKPLIIESNSCAIFLMLRTVVLEKVTTYWLRPPGALASPTCLPRFSSTPVELAEC